MNERKIRARRIATIHEERPLCAARMAALHERLILNGGFRMVPSDPNLEVNGERPLGTYWRALPNSDEETFELFAEDLRGLRYQEGAHGGMWER
jgi:hypothetical protein